MKYVIDKDTLTGIADKIRAKTGSTEAIKVSELADNISAIPEVKNQDKTITENGSYTADDGYTGLGTVTVDVSGETINNQDKSVEITENGTTEITYDDGYTGLNKVEITTNVSGGESSDYKFTGHYDKEGLMEKLGWTEEQVAYCQENGVGWNEEDDDYFKVDDYDVAALGTNKERFARTNEISSRFDGYNGLIAIPTLTSTITSANNLFNGCVSLLVCPQKINITGATTTSAMFGSCYNLKKVPEIDLSNITTPTSMFSGCTSLKTIPQLNLPKATTMMSMFQGCTQLQKIEGITSTSTLLNVNNAFQNCSSLIELPSFDMSSVTNMESFCSGCSSLVTVPDLDIPKVTNMQYAFQSCRALKVAPKINASLATSMNYLFYYCYSLETIKGINAPSAKSMYYWFGYCYALRTIPLIDTSNITQITYTFYKCYSLREIPQLDTSKVTSMTCAFFSCISLSKIPELDMSSITNMGNSMTNRAFYGCSSLTDLGGFKDYGKAFSTSAAASTTSYELYLAYSSLITHDSLMNVINDLYDIASAGCNTQKLTIGSKNLAKLTADEIAIATNKGFTVS